MLVGLTLLRQWADLPGKNLQVGCLANPKLGSGGTRTEHREEEKISYIAGRKNSG